MEITLYREGRLDDASRIRSYCMNKKKIVFIKTGIRISLCVCAALGWWGALYPELTMTPDTYRVVTEDGAVQIGEDVVEWDFDNPIYMEILNADRSRIRFRSRLFQTVSDCMEQKG